MRPPPILPRRQPADHPFGHRPLHLAVLLQPMVVLQLHFFPRPCAHPRSEESHLLPAKHHLARLPSPAECARGRIGMVPEPHPLAHFLVPDLLPDPQPCCAAQSLHLGLQLLPHLGQRQAQMHGQLSPFHNLELPGLPRLALICLSHSGSPFRNDSFPPQTLTESGAESRCFLPLVST